MKKLKELVVKYYAVITPSYTKNVEGFSPPYQESDIVYVEAVTKRIASIHGVRKLRKNYPNGWLQLNSDCNPFTGLKVVEVEKSEYEEFK